MKSRETQPTQSGRVRGVAIELAMNRATQQTENRDCNTVPGKQ